MRRLMKIAIITGTVVFMDETEGRMSEKQWKTDRLIGYRSMKPEIDTRRYEL